MQVLELARCEWIERRENVIASAPAASASHVALGLGLAACQKGLSLGFTTAAIRPGISSRSPEVVDFCATLRLPSRTEP